MHLGSSLVWVKPLLLHAALIGDSGWAPLQYNLLKYWYRVCNLPQECLPKKTIWAGNVADVGKKNCVSQVRLLLEDLNLSDVFVNASNKKETL